MYLKSYKELIVWQRSIELVKEIYKLTELFPKSEIYGLVSQMRRAAVSISSNIAEGYKRKNIGEYLYFLSVAEGSAAELETQIIISCDLYKNIDFKQGASMLEETQKMLFTVIKNLNAKRSALSPRRGFTLVETMIYIGILAAVISSIVGYSLTLSGARNKNYVIQNVQANSRTVLTLVSEKIRSSSAVIAPAAGASSNQLVLDMPGASPNLIFSLADGRVVMSEVGNPDIYLTDSRVSVTDLAFTNAALAGERDIINIQTTVAYKAVAGDVANRYEQALRTSVSRRK